MDSLDLLKSGLGAVVGFALAQIVNLAKVGCSWIMRPRLRIEPVSEDNNWRILMHATEVRDGETLNEEIYGFYVRNIGRTIATGVRFQLIKMEYRERGRLVFSEYSDQTRDLAIYNNSYGERGDETATIIPRAKTLIHLGSWREDYDVVFPATASTPDYYEESCGGASEFRFTVVAFDDRAHFTTSAVTIRAGRR